MQSINFSTVKKRTCVDKNGKRYNIKMDSITPVEE